MARGAILNFVESHQQDNRSRKEEGERIFQLATAAGIKTTRASIEQAVYVVRKRKGIVSTRASALRKRKVARNKPRQSVRSSALENYLDNAVKSLSMLKGEVQRLRTVERQYLKIKAQFE